VVTVVTAVFGTRDRLLEPARDLPGHHLVCVTDQDIESKAWQIMKVDAALEDPRLMSRRVKILAQEFVDAERIVWVDASMRVQGDLRPLVSDEAELVLVRHPRRICAYAEIEVCRELGIADAKDLAQQAERYRREGFPAHAGLYALGLIGRRMTAAVKKLCYDWWAEVVRSSPRDQTSLPFVLRRHPAVTTRVLDIDILDNPYVQRVRGRDRGPYGSTASIHAPVAPSVVPAAPVTPPPKPPAKPAAAPAPKPTAPKLPRIHTTIAYDRKGNLGAAYNAFMEGLPKEAWACFLDHDAMFTTRSWHDQISAAITREPKAIFTAVCNRIGNGVQLAPKVDPNNHDIHYHRKLGQRLLADKTLQDVTKGPLLSGVLIVISKAAWTKLGGFKPGFLGVDNQMHLDARRAGYKVLIIRGLYLYHWYRAHGDDAHIKKLPKALRHAPV
jgi:hypothetical protein